MGPRLSLIVPLAEAGACEDGRVGGKARALGRLLDAGHRVPDGFCIDVHAYGHFVASAGLAGTIQMELGRKPLSTMRWEEIWDAALRIRSAFLATPLPALVADPIRDAYRRLSADAVAVRSSAPGEDSAQRSYAGLHESLVGVNTEQGLLDAVRIVWASLWSDAALLYRKELGLDVESSRMAVVVQELVTASVSGVAFGIDPRRPKDDRAVVEAVPGLCEDLVSGAVDPDRWMLKRSSGEIVSWTPGERDASGSEPLLRASDLALLHQTLQSVEALLGHPPDVEWTGQDPDLTLLQARPVTIQFDDDEDRTWYLSLRLGARRLRDLCTRVTDELIPALAAEGTRLAAEDIDTLTDAGLADAAETRRTAYEKWQRIYRDEFIPFAHGVRRLGQYYNDAVRPDDPYEFVGLLENQPMLASERNQALAGLAASVRRSQALAGALAELADAGRVRSRKDWRRQSPELPESPATEAFRQEFDVFLDRYMDMTYQGESLDDRPDLAIQVVLQLAGAEERPQRVGQAKEPRLEERLFEAVGHDREEEAREVLRIGRLSWRLRDDDNILMGRLQNQLLRALTLAADRLKRAGRLDESVRIGATLSGVIIAALRDPHRGSVVVPSPARPEPPPHPLGVSPRQLVGQPAARGLATGLVRVVRDAGDMGKFRRGEVMVCDAIQPTMTHLVPLASAVIERRGGMLIHGAIIARELGVPCVNGIADVTRLLRDGDLVTVDGQLGIVTVGPPDFEMESRFVL